MAQLINEAKRFQKLAGIIKEAKVGSEYIQAIEDAKAALTIINRLSLDNVAREAIEGVLYNILPGIVDSEGNLMEEDSEIDQKKKVQDSINENASYTVHLKIDGKTVMSRTSDNILDNKEMSDNLTALESKYRDKYDFTKAEIVVLDPSGKEVGSLTTKDQRYMKWPFNGSRGGYSGDIGSSGFYEGKK